MTTPEELRSKFEGVIAFPITPFHDDLSLNIDGLKQNLERLLEHPICAIIAAGGTGEMYSLTPEEHLEVVKTTVDVVGGKVPVMTAVGFNSQLAAEMAKKFAAAGVDGILAFPPYYPNAEEGGLIQYYKAIGEATPLGMAIYSRDWVSPGPGFVERIANEIPTLVAWKDGQGDMRRYQMIINHVGDRLRWIGGAGDDLAPSYYNLGIRTYTSSLVNISPGLALDVHKYAAAGDHANLDPLMTNYVVPHYAFRVHRKGYEVSVVKAKLNLMGVPAGPVRPPLADVGADDLETLRKMLESWKPILR